MNLRQNLGATVKQRRQELGLSQVQLAELMSGHVQQSDISRIERGQLPWPRPDLLHALASGLGLSSLELLTSSGWMSPAELEKYRHRVAARPPKALVLLGLQHAGDDLALACTSPLFNRFRMLMAFDGATVKESLCAHAPAIAILQQDVPGLRLAQIERTLDERGLNTQVILVGHGGIELPGAFHFIEAPVALETLATLAERLVTRSSTPNTQAPTARFE